MKNPRKKILYIGQLGSTKIYLHWTFLILPLLIAIFNVSTGYNGTTTVWNIALQLALLVSVFIHEYVQVLVARAYNIKPPHMILLPIGGITPFNIREKKPKAVLLTALTGPVISLIIAAILIFYVYFTGLLDERIFSDPAVVLNPSAANFLSLVFAANLLIGLLNLIPAFPMDANQILKAVLSDKMSRAKVITTTSHIGQAVGIALIAAGVIFHWLLIFPGILAFLGARWELISLRSKFTLRDHTANDILMPKYHQLSPNDTLCHALVRVLDKKSENFLVMNKGYVIGSFNHEHMLHALNATGDENLPVTKIMSHHITIVTPDTLLSDIYLEQIKRAENNHVMPVVNYKHQVLGVIDMQNIMKFITLQQSATATSEKTYSQQL